MRLKEKIIVLLLVGLLAGCKNKIALNEDNIPTTLIIGAFVGEGPEESHSRYDGVAEYLEKKLGIDVEIILTTDYTSIIESLRSKKIHVGYMSPFAYVISYDKGNFKPIITFGTDTGTGPYLYRSVIFTNSKSGLETFADVRTRAKEISLCFTDPASTSGHMVPRAYLKSQGLDPANAFKQTIFASSHAASVMTVHSGKVDVGCTYESALQKLIVNGTIGKDDVRVLWTSDPIINTPIVVRSDLDDAFVRKLQEAYLQFPKEDSVSWHRYLSQLFTNPQGVKYIVAYDSMYDGVRKIASGITDINQ